MVRIIQNEKKKTKIIIKVLTEIVEEKIPESIFNICNHQFHHHRPKSDLNFQSNSLSLLSGLFADVMLINLVRIS